MPELDDFRQDTRSWLEQNCPQAMRQPIRSDEDICWGGRDWKFQSAEQKQWLERMAERGWTAPTWPREYGGGGLSKEKAKVLQQELTAIGARSPLDSFGIWMIGPALLKFGSEALKQQHLPLIVRGEIRWCQGYSEPNAGSDLAGLQCKAEDRGDHFNVNGQKVWTSYADKSDWMFCLVRTNANAKKQMGISLVLFDMQTKGVTPKPIKLISGNSPFCETFLENVRVEKNQVVGEIDQGWTIAKYLLTHEREMIGSLGLEGLSGSLYQVVEEAKAAKITVAANLENDIAQWEVDALSFALTTERIKDELDSGQGIGSTSAMLKYYGTELNKRRYELLLRLKGEAALVTQGDDYDDGLLAQRWLRSKGNSIEGGTSEIQLNIIAKHILGLG